MRTTLFLALLLALILVAGSFWLGQSAQRDTQRAVQEVSLFYLDELAGRRQQVVASNLQSSMNSIRAAVGLLDKENLKDAKSLQSYQTQMKRLFNLEKFAFVDQNGQIYLSTGVEPYPESYRMDFTALDRPTVEVKSRRSRRKRVILATPIEPVPFEGQQLVVCFMEMEVDRLLEGVSLQSDQNSTTFCNLYDSDGTPLTNQVLGGLAVEDNLLVALEHAKMDPGFSLETMKENFMNGKEGVVSFVYDGISESLYFVPVEGTDWQLTYLIRDSVISGQISGVTRSMLTRGVLQSGLTALVLILMFLYMFHQSRRSAVLTLEKETQAAENRARQEELEQRIRLQEQLLEQEKQRAEQDQMITALASDYRSVYYVDLDTDQGICYRADSSSGRGLKDGEHFAYLQTFKEYARNYVSESYREEFLKFIEPENIRRGLEKETILSCRYLVRRDGREAYEMLRMAGVRNMEDRPDHQVHAVGVGFTDIDREMRETLAKNQALSDALAVAEDASRAKTAFLSNMSHEIRTPMNAIIGLDSIALSNPDLPESTRDHLKKIGSSAHHLLNIINDILDMSRIESGRMALRNEEFSFSRLIEQVSSIISAQCSEKGLHYSCRVSGDVSDSYIGDDMKLRQVLINILGNAVEFTPEGGSVEFTVEKAAAFDGKTTLRFIMKDTGIGMDPEFLPRIFDAFSQEDSSSTSKYGSTGLGMAITKNIVDMMNGRIEVQSEKGRGSVFTVTVTFTDCAESGAAEEGEDLKPGQISVLVVDDDPTDCEHARLVLEQAGFTAETATTGPEAVEMARVRHARRDPYNLILVDWKMPEMDGVETTRQIRAIAGNESAIVILTAYRWDDVMEDAVNAGVDSFISKPLFAANVLEEFRRAAKRKNRSLQGAVRKAELKGRHILLAEDMPINAEIITMVLKMREMEVSAAVNGREAVDLFAGSPEGFFDAVLMDMRMPEMDGLTATAAIRAMDRKDAKTVPIIALTANAFDEDVQRSLQAGLNAHLSKPVEPELLYGTLEELIRDPET